jgi:class I fructose-bisphosphate aldolase
MANQQIVNLLGDKAEFLLNYECKTIDKSTIHTPSPTHVDDQWINSNRSNQVLRSLQGLLDHGRLGGTGYCSIFPVDQGIEHSGGSAFAPNPIYFDPKILSNLL